MKTSFCFLWLILVSPVWAQWQLISPSSPAALGHDAWHIEKQVAGPTQGVATYKKEMWPVKNLIIVTSRP